MDRINRIYGIGGIVNRRYRRSRLEICVTWDLDGRVAEDGNRFRGFIFCGKERAARGASGATRVECWSLVTLLSGQPGLLFAVGLSEGAAACGFLFRDVEHGPDASVDVFPVSGGRAEWVFLL